MSGDSNEKYSLRPRSAKKKSKVLQESSDEDHNQTGATQQQQTKLKAKPPPLSKYRRKTANARERSRMHEINVAFETLRQVVPSFNTVAVAIEAPSAECTSSTKSAAMNEKLTKITTLRLAMRYIQMLNDLLQESDSSDEMTSCTQLPEAHETIQVPADSETVKAPFVTTTPAISPTVVTPATNSTLLFAPPPCVTQASVDSCISTVTQEIFDSDPIAKIPDITTSTSTISTTGTATAMPTLQQIANTLINNNNNNNNQNHNLNYIQNQENHKQIALVDFLSDCRELDCLLMESSDGESSSLLASSNSPNFSDSLSSVDFDDPATLLTCHDFVDQPLSICEFNDFFLV